jgi:hypothetical protein
MLKELQDLPHLLRQLPPTTNHRLPPGLRDQLLRRTRPSLHH